MPEIASVILDPERQRRIQAVETNPALRAFRKPCEHDICRQVNQDCGDGPVVLLPGDKRTYYEDSKNYRMLSYPEEQRWVRDEYPNVVYQQRRRAILVDAIRETMRLRPHEIRIDDLSIRPDDELEGIYRELQADERNTILKVYNRRLEIVDKALAEGTLVKAKPLATTVEGIEVGPADEIERQTARGRRAG